MVYRKSLFAKARFIKKRRYGYAKKRYASSLYKLGKQVKQLRTNIRRKRTILHTSSEQDYTKDLITPQQHVRLTRLSDHKGILGTDTNDLIGDKVRLISLSSHVHISLENVDNEEATTNFSVFLVSLKDSSGGMIDRTTGFLALTANQDYYSHFGWAYLNKDRFNIHHYKHFTLTNYGTALTSSGAQSKYGTDIDFDWKTPVNKIIYANQPGNDTNQTSPFNNLYQADPSQNYYIIVFTDNLSADSESPLMKNFTIASWEKLD